MKLTSRILIGEIHCRTRKALSRLAARHDAGKAIPAYFEWPANSEVFYPALELPSALKLAASAPQN